MNINIFEIKEYHDDFLYAINKLLPQLSSTAEPLKKEDLTKIIESNSIRLLFAEKNKQLLGTLTLVLFQIPTGFRARIEDVIVDNDARGQGIGKMLIRHAIQLAKNAGAKAVDLTSHPSRKAANEMYQKTDFEIRETNVYRHSII